MNEINVKIGGKIKWRSGAPFPNPYEATGMIEKIHFYKNEVSGFTVKVLDKKKCRGRTITINAHEVIRKVK
jgi:hypothetical protein